MKNKFIQKIITTGDSLALFPLRLAVGAVFVGHGGQKLFGWFDGNGLKGTGEFLESALGLKPGLYWAAAAGGAEFLGGLLLILGLFTRIGGILIAGVMTVAILMVHRHAFFLDDNGMEFALTLFTAGLAFLIAGAAGFPSTASSAGGVRKKRRHALPAPATSRRCRTASAKPAKTSSVVSREMQASVMLWP